MIKFYFEQILIDNYVCYISEIHVFLHISHLLKRELKTVMKKGNKEKILMIIKIVIETERKLTYNNSLMYVSFNKFLKYPTSINH